MCFYEKGNHVCDKCKNNCDQKIHAYMARMCGNDLCPSEKFGDSSQLTKWILDSRATCHMIPRVLYFITGSLKDTDKYIDVADGHHVTSKQNGQVRIKMCNNNGDTFIAILHYVVLATYLCHRICLIIMLMNSGHSCVLHKGFCTVYFIQKAKNAVTFPHSTQRKHAFLGEIKDMSTKNKLPARKKISLELLH